MLREYGADTFLRPRQRAVAFCNNFYGVDRFLARIFHIDWPYDTMDFALSFSQQLSKFFPKEIPVFIFPFRDSAKFIILYGRWRRKIVAKKSAHPV